MKITGVQVMLGVAIGALTLLGYMSDAVNYYQPRAGADTEHASIRSWSELESINHQIEILELKIQRIVDMAKVTNRGLTDEERQQIASLREEIRFHNDRKHQILARQK